MSETIHQPNGLSDSTSMPPSASIAVPPEIESTLSRLSAYRSVRGVMILSRAPPPTSSSTTGSSSAGAAGSTTAQGLGGIVQCTGSIFEEESGQRYATMVEGLVAVAAKGVGERDQGDELKMMRIRTKRHELIITPDEKYILVVLQDPSQ